MLTGLRGPWFQGSGARSPALGSRTAATRAPVGAERARNPAARARIVAALLRPPMVRLTRARLQSAHSRGASAHRGGADARRTGIIACLRGNGAHRAEWWRASQWHARAFHQLGPHVASAPTRGPRAQARIPEAQARVATTGDGIGRVPAGVRRGWRYLAPTPFSEPGGTPSDASTPSEDCRRRRAQRPLPARFATAGLPIPPPASWLATPRRTTCWG